MKPKTIKSSDPDHDAVNNQQSGENRGGTKKKIKTHPQMKFIPFKNAGASFFLFQIKIIVILT